MVNSWVVLFAGLLLFKRKRKRCSSSEGPLPGQIQQNLDRRLPTSELEEQGCNGSRERVFLAPEMVGGVLRVVDICLVVGASGAAFALYLGVTMHSAAELERYLLSSLVAAALFVTGFQYIEGYTLKQLSMLRWQVTRASATWAITVAVLLLMAFVTKISETYSRGWALAWTPTTLAFLLIVRVIVRFAIGRWVEEGCLARKLVVVGAGEEGERLITRIRRSQDRSIVICGIFDDRKTRIPDNICGCKVLGNTDDLLHFASHVPVEDVIIALPLSASERLKALVDKLRRLPGDLHLSAEPIAEKFPLRSMSQMSGVPLLRIVERPIKHWSAVAKWVEDKVLATLLLFALAPAMAMIALLIKLESPGPVLFVQDRFGFNNNVIRIYKFRTMYVDRADISGAQRTVQNDPRVTRVGHILRWLSLDELPQLLNVLTGEMSLVGPRPHATAMRVGDRPYFEAVEEYTQRHRVKPGITGWAQVNGCRGEIDTLLKARARVELDLYYIERWTLWLDLKTLILTVLIVLSRKSAY
jgi:Undecaprenyl-phosphate glucose phosphotransferase